MSFFETFEWTGRCFASWFPNWRNRSFQARLGSSRSSIDTHRLGIRIGAVFFRNEKLAHTLLTRLRQESRCCRGCCARRVVGHGCCCCGRCRRVCRRFWWRWRTICGGRSSGYIWRIICRRRQRWRRRRWTRLSGVLLRWCTRWAVCCSGGRCGCS